MGIHFLVSADRRSSRVRIFGHAYRELRVESIANAELQIRSRDFDNEVRSVFLQSHWSVVVSVRSTHGFKCNVNFEAGAVPTYEGAVQSC